MKIKAFTAVFFLFFLFTAIGYTNELIIKENIETISSPPDKTRLLGFNSNFPHYDQIALAIFKNQKMYAQINNKLLGPYPHLGKNTPFFAPNSNTSAFCVFSDDKDYVVIDGQEKKKYLGIGNIIFSSNGKTYAYRAQTKKGLMVVVNDNEGEIFDGIKDDPVVSGNGKKIAYTAFKSSKEAFVVCNNKKYGPYRNVKEIKFSPDSSKIGFIAFTDKNKKGWIININGKESKVYKNAMLLTFSSKNDFACAVQNFNDKLLILNNFKEGTPYSTIGHPTFNPNGTILSYPAKTNNSWQMVINDKKEDKFDQLGPVTYSDSGNSYGYTGIKNNKPIIVINGKKEKTYDSSGLIKFSSKGEHYAYRAFKKDKGWFVVWDGKEGTAYLDVKQPIFNPNKNEIAYMAFNGKNVFMIKNHKPGQPYKSIGLPKFSPKGKYLAYHATHDDKKWILNIEGKETKETVSFFLTKYPIVFESETKLYCLGMNNFDFIKYNCTITD